MAANGTVIEQAQILTTHNLAALVHAVSVAPTVGWPETARRTFATVLQLAGRIERNPRLLRLIQDTAYAWRHLVFFPCRFHTLATGGVHVDLTDAAPAVRVKIEPALVGLGYIAAGGRFADERTPAGGHRLLASSPSDAGLSSVAPAAEVSVALSAATLRNTAGTGCPRPGPA